MSLIFFMPMDPPTATAQMKKAYKRPDGKIGFYEPKSVKIAKAKLLHGLESHVPDEPFDGALRLECNWRFPATKTHKDGEWRTSRPDTDNLQKMLKDCMTYMKYWQDDAQVAVECVDKSWSDDPGIQIVIQRI